MALVNYVAKVREGRLLELPDEARELHLEPALGRAAVNPKVE